MNINNEYIDWGFHCPSCGYCYLKLPPHRNPGGASYEICPCCGIQFGYDDDDRGITYAQWLEDWIVKGMPWFSKSIPPPKGWVPEDQLSQMILD